MASVRPNRSVWDRFDLQLGGCLLIAAVLPYLIRGATLDPKALVVLHQTLIGIICAIVLGTWLLRNVTTYPGVETGAYILPAFTVSYFALLLVFVLGRLEYNRLTLALGYLLSVGWFVAVHLRRDRRQELRIGLLRLGDLTGLQQVGGIMWVPLDNPERVPEGLDAVATDLRIDLPSEWDRRIADFALEGVPVYHVKHLVESLTGRVELEHLSENSFGSLVPLTAYMSLKHWLDWISALVFGIVALPVLLVIALIVKLDSPGPALFRQERIGFRGKPFTVYKFRTMTVLPANVDEREAAKTKSGDQRVTRVGRFMRQTRIDELPQFLNILKGEMSWIGPRPEAAVLSRWYEQEIPFYRYRHIVRPGLAGWAQVCQGHVAEVAEVRSKLHYDFYYIKHFSPWIDLLIVARTFRTVITGFGAR